MEWRITPQQISSLSGQRVLVRLFFPNPNEHATIFHNECQRLEVGPLTFRDLYRNPAYTTLLKVPSRLQQHEFIGILDRQLAEVNKLIQRSKTFRAQAAPRPKVEVAWNFFEEKRFSHTHIVAGTDSGKTTLLSALIQEDLDKVARDEASILILDSQNGALGYSLPRLARFAPGGDLDGKLIYLKPDLNHPLALNPFRFTTATDDLNEQLRLLGTTAKMLSLFMGAVIGEPTTQAENVMHFCLRAIAYMRNPNMETLFHLLTKGKFKELYADDEDLRPLDARVRQILEEDLFKDYTPTVTALRNRLNGFIGHPLFQAMFSASENRVDLYDLLGKPNVVIVNTDRELLQDAAEPFGRYFLAQLLNIVRRRQPPHASKFPCYVFLDEAQDYIAKEPAIVPLIQEARRQRVALTFAHHTEAVEFLPAVAAELRNMMVQMRSDHEYSWNVDIRGRAAPITNIKPPKVDFTTQAPMPDPVWHSLLVKQWEHYSVTGPSLPTVPAVVERQRPEGDAI